MTSNSIHGIDTCSESEGMQCYRLFRTVIDEYIEKYENAELFWVSQCVKNVDFRLDFPFLEELDHSERISFWLDKYRYMDSKYFTEALRILEFHYMVNKHWRIPSYLFTSIEDELFICLFYILLQQPHFEIETPYLAKIITQTFSQKFYSVFFR